MGGKKANISSIHKQLNTDLLHSPYETLYTTREKVMDNVDHRPKSVWFGGFFGNNKKLLQRHGLRTAGWKNQVSQTVLKQETVLSPQHFL